MSLNMHPAQIQEMVNFSMLSDREIRSDLAIGMITGENDYTSNFTGALRRNINSYSHTGLSATSFTLGNSDEQKTGTDATIIITSNGYSKVILFEAKWPRLATPNYRWDYKQTASGLSHFSDQLERQGRWPRFAIFEMFYLEYQFGGQPATMPNHGSACTWHKDAYTFKKARSNPDAIWDQGDLNSMLQKNCNTIGEIVKSVCECRNGKAFHMDDAKDMASEFGLMGPIMSISADFDQRIAEQDDAPDAYGAGDL